MALLKTILTKILIRVPFIMIINAAIKLSDDNSTIIVTCDVA